MSSVLVVLGQPVVSDHLHLLNGTEQVSTEHFRSERLVEAFDVDQGNAFALCRLDKAVAAHLRAVVYSNCKRSAVPVHGVVHRADQHRGGQRLGHLDSQHLAVGCALQWLQRGQD